MIQKGVLHLELEAKEVFYRFWSRQSEHISGLLKASTIE